MNARAWGALPHSPGESCWPSDTPGGGPPPRAGTRLRVVRPPAEPEDGVQQRAFDQDEHPERPVEGLILDMVADAGEIGERLERRLREPILAAPRQHEAEEQEKRYRPGGAPGGSGAMMH